jgi:hypothetical protein
MAEGQETSQNIMESVSLPVLTSPGSIAEKPFIVNSSNDTVIEILRTGGIEAKVIPLPKGGGFAEAIVIQKKEIPKEKMVRVYRGINQSDASFLKQVPYAMRADSEEHNGFTVLDNVMQEVDALANDPTYEHLLVYVNKIRPQLIERQQKKLDESLTEIEDGVLRGRSVRNEIAFDQIMHGAGHLDSGVSPYVSVSFSSIEASRYTRENGVLIVMDVPISQIEDLNSNIGEANIKGVIDTKYITAIIPRDGTVLKDDQASEQAIDKTLQIVSETAQIPIYNSVETKLVRENQILTNREKDKRQWPTDVEAIRQKRAANLASQFSEVGLNIQEIQQAASDTKTDIYTKAKTDIFDYYTNRLGKIGRGGKDVTDYRYETGKNFDRDNIDDKMLLQLRVLVQRQEQKEAERNINR